MRRMIVVMIMAALACLDLGLPTMAAPPEGGVPGDQADRYLERAVVLYDAMNSAFRFDESHLYWETFPADGRIAYLWPVAQTIAATIALADAVPGDSRYRDDLDSALRALDQYWDAYGDPPAYSSANELIFGESDRYYDDNNWVALALIAAWGLTSDPIALTRARAVFEFLVSGWDDRSGGPAPGGVRWVDASWNADRNSVSTAPAAEIGLRLAELSDSDAERQRYLRWSERMYAWVETYMQSENGLIWDRVEPDGSIIRDFGIDNQGSMIGASLMLYRVTGDVRRLNAAVSIALSAIEYYGDGLLALDRPAHKIVLFRNLLALYEHVRNPEFIRPVQEYAEVLWSAREPSTGLISTSVPLTLLDQAAIVELHAVLARFSGLSIRGAASAKLHVPAADICDGRNLRITPLLPTDADLLEEWRGRETSGVFGVLSGAAPKERMTRLTHSARGFRSEFVFVLRRKDNDEPIGFLRFSGQRTARSVSGVTLAGEGGITTLRSTFEALELSLHVATQIPVDHRPAARSPSGRR